MFHKPPGERNHHAQGNPVETIIGSQAKDFLYRSGGTNHIFFACKHDHDYTNDLNSGKMQDIVIYEKTEL